MVLNILKQKHVSGDRLMLNIGIPAPSASTDTSVAPHDARLKKIREAFPNAVIALSPSSDGPYDEKAIAQIARYSKEAGAPVMFPLRADLVTPGTVMALKPYGKVAIWNDLGTWSPADIAKEEARFRSWGVDGMIDLRKK